ncbi:epithelial sodium channel subunit alpha-like [Convolutriloba macropyga]|uniref:epithelial sodium channel subunit alpha-like n=1 Tax=Convolutriloba macropyga TaxID=536237 RepID=UPI003F520FF4
MRVGDNGNSQLKGDLDAAERGHIVLRHYDKGYSQMLCISECYSEIEFDLCQCKSLSQLFFTETTLECGTTTMTMCPVLQEELLRICSDRCKPQCSFTKYNFQLTSSSFPNQGFHANYKILDPHNNVSFQYMRKNYAELNINMASLIIQHTHLYPKYEIFSAGSAMGGLFGLLLGGSVLSIYELVELFLRLIVSGSKTFLTFIWVHKQRHKVYPCL